MRRPYCEPHHDFLETDGHRALVTKQDHAAGIGDAENIHAQAVGHDGCPVVISCKLGNRLTSPHFGLEGVDGDLAAFRGVGHGVPPL